MTTSGKQGLPPRTLAGILVAAALVIGGVSFAARKPQPAAAPDATAADSRPPSPGAQPLDPERYRGSITLLEAAVYTNAGVERLPESAHALAAAVMAQNRTNPMVRPVVIELETRLDRLAQMGGTSPETIQAWEAIRREYFKPASWWHAPQTPAAQ